MLKKNLLMILVVFVTGCIMINVLPMFNKTPITIAKSTTFFKKGENKINEDLTEDLENNNTNIQDNNISNIENVDSNVDKNEISNLKSSNSNVNTDENKSDSSTISIEVPTINYDRTTKIYENDYKTLIRVEYYKNNKLAYYSSVLDFDTQTNSYVEEIYMYDYESDIEKLVRTDIYSNGVLTKSY